MTINVVMFVYTHRAKLYKSGMYLFFTNLIVFLKQVSNC
jgi:hypothetical protein